MHAFSGGKASLNPNRPRHIHPLHITRTCLLLSLCGSHWQHTLKMHSFLPSRDACKAAAACSCLHLHTIFASHRVTLRGLALKIDPLQTAFYLRRFHSQTFVVSHAQHARLSCSGLKSVFSLVPQPGNGLFRVWACVDCPMQSCFKQELIHLHTLIS